MLEMQTQKITGKQEAGGTAYLGNIAIPVHSMKQRRAYRTGKTDLVCVT